MTYQSRRCETTGGSLLSVRVVRRFLDFAWKGWSSKPPKKDLLKVKKACEIIDFTGFLVETEGFEPLTLRMRKVI